MKKTKVARNVASTNRPGSLFPTFKRYATNLAASAKSIGSQTFKSSNARFVVILIVGILLMVAGLAILVGMLRARSGNLAVMPVSHVVTTKRIQPAVQKIEGTPVKLNIPSLDMDLEIAPGTYNPITKTWNVSITKVHYATITPPPNNVGGNTFLYGHYRKNIFASLHTIKPDEMAIVTTDNGHVFYYKLSGIRIVDPTDTTGIFDYTGKPILTIQTCTGLFYEKRQLFTFDLQRVV